jgi:hypothetical protein
MIISHMKRHGAKILPAAANALRNISEEDIQIRVGKKFNSLQKAMREAGILDAQNRRINQTVTAPENGGPQAPEPSQAAVKRKQTATLASRAKGVSKATIVGSVIDTKTF